MFNMGTDYSSTSNRERFAMRRQNLYKSKMNMNEAIGMSCKNTDIISTVKSNKDYRRSQEPSLSIDHNVNQMDQDTASRFNRLSSSVQEASVASNFPLLPIQVKAICRTVYRPSSTIDTSFLGRPTRTFATPSSDIKAPVIIDMPTGTGKTITAIMGSVMYAIERKSEFDDANKVVSSVFGMTETTGKVQTSSIPGAKCIIFSPRHLVEHWAYHAEIAKKIVQNMTFSDGSKWTLKVVQNKLASKEVAGHNEVLLIVCDSSRCGVKKYLETGVYYSSICFDEVGERDCKVNAMFQKTASSIQSLMYGRLVMCSADFGKWGSHEFTPSVNTMLRGVFPMWSSNTLWEESTAATCVTSAVFDQYERDTVMTECTSALDSSILDVATVSYKPSLTERLGGGYATDLGSEVGSNLFSVKYNVDVRNCNTIEDILAKVSVKRAFYNTASNAPEATRCDQHVYGRRIEVLDSLCTKLREIASEDCPICFEKMDSVSMIQPCLHFTCSNCMEHIKDKCPMCRGEFHGTVGVKTAGRSIEVVQSENEERPQKRARTESDVTTVSPARIGDLFFDEMGRIVPNNSSISGVTTGIKTVLRAVHSAKDKSSRSTQTFRTMIICPGTEVRDGLFDECDSKVFHYKTSGDKRTPVTRKKMKTMMDSFKANDGTSKILVVRDSGVGDKQDSMTGLDIPLDCVISVGGGNLAQRMGRLCRLSRISLPEEKKHALYVEVVPERM